MRVGHNKAFAIAMICLAAACIVLGLISVSIAYRPTLGTYLPLLSGGMCLFAGIAMLTRTAFEVTDDAVIVYALIGPVRRTYPFSSRRDVRIVDNRLRVGDKKLIRKYNCDAGDWAKLATMLTFE